MKSAQRFLIFSLLSLFLLGCSSISRPEQPIHQSNTLLHSDKFIGQTFVANFEGLDGIGIYLEPIEHSKGEILLHLRDSPDSTQDLEVISLSLSEITSPAFYHFKFPSQKDSFGKYYYFFLELKNQGKIKVGTAEPGTYLDGSLYQNHKSKNSQTNFQLDYSLNIMLLGLGKEILVWMGLLLVALFLTVLPGWALLDALWSRWEDRNWVEKTVLAISVGVALYPVLILWTSVFRLRLGVLYAWLPPLLGIFYLLWKYRENFLKTRASPRTSIFNKIKSNFAWADLGLLIVLGFVFFVRFWVIRTLEAPMWGDSYQHTMISQLIVDNKGLFQSWEPYAQLITFTYHFGFHSISAVFHWLTSFPMEQAVLWTGQILNGFAVMALYPLAVRLGGNRWAGVSAVLIAGLVVSMPMFYVNWGRFTQLTGQVILLASVYLTWDLLEKKTIDWRLTSLNVLVLAGLAFTHYRVFIFWVLFLTSIWLLKVRRRNLQTSIIHTLTLGVGTSILLLPWLMILVQGKWFTVLSSRVSTPSQSVSTYLQQYNAFGDLSKYLPPWVWALLIICIAWGLWKRNSGTALIGLWWLLLLFATNPAWIYLPGTGVISNFAILIAAYIPAGIIIGAAVAWSINSIKRQIKSETSSKANWLYWGTISFSFLLLLFLIICGSLRRLSDFRPLEHALVTSPDVQAYNWINDFTSPEDRFLVNSFFAFNDSTIVGSDAGWWLPLLAHRQNTQPPINYATEQGTIPGYREWVNELVASIQKWGISDQDSLQQLQKRDITHIYIGQQQGRVNTTSPLLDPQELLESPFYTLIYHQDRVWIFSVTQ